MPRVTPVTTMAARATKVDQSPSCSTDAPTSAASTGSMAWPSTSHSRNTSTPMATALRKAWRRGAGLRRRPMGRPRKMVKPAIAPSTMIWPEDMRRDVR